MKEFWDQRYREPEYAYGIQPNVFFKETLAPLSPGKILLPAEGEGRNAVYAATQGWDVRAFDFSSEAKRKALALARQHQVSIRYDVLDVRDYAYPDNTFDVIRSFFTHIPYTLRPAFHRALIRSLRPGGHIILEAFHKNQVNYSSGGPKDLAMLFSIEELGNEFNGLTFQALEDKLIELNEGPYHQGKAHVVRMIAIKQ